MLLFNSMLKEKSLAMAQSLAGTFDPEAAREWAAEHVELSWLGDFKILLGMLTDKEFTLAKSTWLMIAGVLAYVVMPMDVIPDFILGMGFVDDAFVLSVVMRKIADEVAQYKEERGI